MRRVGQQFDGALSLQLVDDGLNALTRGVAHPADVGDRAMALFGEHLEDLNLPGMQSASGIGLVEAKGHCADLIEQSLEGREESVGIISCHIDKLLSFGQVIVN